jgi:putative tryptophan/tyrosine transport system substrate-binding protein
MRRRDFVILLGGAAAPWPVGVHAQRMPVRVVGFISTRSPADSARLVPAFRRGLAELGYVEGENVAVEYRWAEGRRDRLPALAADLVRRQVTVIVAFAPPAALAAKAATSTIPVIFTTGTDPLKLGLIASFNRPGGNVTGVIFFSTGLEQKCLELLHEMVPDAAVIGVLVNPNFPEVETQLKDVSVAVHTIGRQIVVLRANSERSIDAAFAAFIEQRTQALLVASDPFFFNARDQLVALSARHAVPAIYQLRTFTAAGGLMSYGTSLEESYRQSGIYAGKILAGAKPADLPVLQATKFELVINLKTAKALGLEVPAKLLALADEVIE